MIKIGVEAAEAEVLIGADDLLQEPPIVLCEDASRNSIEASDLLTKRGYTISDGDLPAEDRTPVMIALPTTLAIPDGHS
jgi:hypothetical protein